MRIWDFLFKHKESCFGESEFLYHYTSFDTLKKFVADGGDFYCTNYRELNDCSEMVIGVDFACKFFRRHLHWDDQKLDSFRTIYLQSIARENVVVPWIMSFSRAQDNLNQWRAYTNQQQGGVAVGIRRAELWNAIDRFPGRYSRSVELNANTHVARMGFELRLLPCLYAQRDEKLIEDLVSEMLLPHLQAFRRMGANDIMSRPLDLILAVNAVLELSSIIKHDSFHDEEEERLILLPMTRSSADCSSVGGKLRWRTYISEVQKEGIMSEKFRGLRGMIREIWISPHGECDTLQLSAQKLLHENNMTFCSLRKSLLPYR